jgi:hypothetical protein
MEGVQTLKAGRAANGRPSMINPWTSTDRIKATTFNPVPIPKRLVVFSGRLWPGVSADSEKGAALPQCCFIAHRTGTLLYRL